MKIKYKPDRKLITVTGASLWHCTTTCSTCHTSANHIHWHRVNQLHGQSHHTDHHTITQPITSTVVYHVLSIHLKTKNISNLTA